MIQQAISLGLKNICFTDHNDFDYPLEDGKMPFQLDFKGYFAEMTRLRDKYNGIISIYIGVEQGLQQQLAKKVNDYDPDHVLDFIIGSSHLVHDADPYYQNYWECRSVYDAILSYYQSISENISCCSNFDVYGHIDYIIRYAPGKDSSYNWKDYTDIIDVILKSLIERGKGIEINTAGLKYGLKEPHPCYGILSRYHELGGEIITTGSDGHCAEHMAYDFHLIPDILKSAGFDYYTIFKNRKPEFIKL
jgi:histidinol-phosphatase (PHP family)